VRAALREVLAEAAYQRCYVHFLRNALDHVPRRVDDDCLQELRRLGACPRAGEAGPGGSARPHRGAPRFGRLAHQVVRQILKAHRLGRREHRRDADPRLRGGRLFYRLPRQHHKHLKSTNMLERLNEEIRRRTQVVRIFPNGESCLRLVRALAVETHENWLEQHRYLNMDDLREHKKEALRSAA
jgi:putative transposase